MDTESKNIVGVIISVAIAIVFVVGTLMAIDNLTRKERTAQDAAIVKKAETEAYLLRFNNCVAAQGEWDGYRCELKK